jgi:alpha-mannosidase
MILNKEWNNRIVIWMEELKKFFYTQLDTVEFKGFTTFDHLDISEIPSVLFEPMPVGTKWGKEWEYGWFTSEITLPPEAENERIVFQPRVGGEMLVWVNEALAGSKDLKHEEITLTQKGKTGEKYAIIIESYAGHGPRLENGGPYPIGRTPVPEAPNDQVQVQSSGYGIWNEAAYQLWLDVYTLYKLLISIDSKSLRAQKVAEGLKKFTLITDFELSKEERNRTFLEARKSLEPLMQCVNGSTAPVFTIFGQSHLDLAWKWPFEETKRKCARTFSTQVALMNEYTDYRFLMCEPPIIETIKEYYPSLYKEVKEKIINGQLMPEGGMWVESDTNMPSGESLIRQFTWGKRWFKETWDYDTKMAWMPDTFGFSGALPQIMLGCGIKYFATQKILRYYPECEPFPYNIFMWEGIDGSKILSHIYKKNNCQYDPQQLIERWEKDRNQQEDIDRFLFPFGYGDGGGGPTRDMLEIVQRTKDLEGAPRTKMESPIDFFEAIESQGLPKNTYVGELYLQWHRGTYTSQAKTKWGNRKSEVMLREIEFWSTMGVTADSITYPLNELNKLWNLLLFNQFHDILPGTSITRVHEEAERDFNIIKSSGTELCNTALTSLVAPNEESLVVFNSLCWERSALVRLPKGKKDAFDQNGRLLSSQEIDDDVFVRVVVPSCGWTSIEFGKGIEKENSKEKADLDRVEPTLENEFLCVKINSKGEITSVFDKETGREVAEGLCNVFKMYKDVNIDYDAWEIGSMYESLPVPLEEEAKIEIVSKGELLTCIKVERMLHHSKMTQEIVLEKGSRRIDFKTRIDWQESHKLLKVEFPVDILADEALHEIQFGYIKRPTHQSRQFDADRYEVSCHRYTALVEAERGCAVLNDSKYGVSCKGNTIQLTLLKAPLIPDMYADKGIQEFTYSFYPFKGPFNTSGVVQEGYELNVPVQIIQGFGGHKSLFEISNKNIILETVKIADDQSGDIIIRLYESQKTAVQCNFSVNLPISYVYETDMLEENKILLKLNQNNISLKFRPFEIKTLRLKRN